MIPGDREPIRASPLLGALVGLGLLFLLVAVLPSPAERRWGEVVHETQSDYSHIRIREKDGVRSLLFVDPRGAEQCQSSIDLDSPGELALGYTRAMFLSHLFRHPQERVLVVGLGGGGMIRFLETHNPGTAIEAVEIDPEIVRIADQWFETREGARVAIHTADAFDFLQTDPGPYDVIYMDAFLRPAEDSGLDRKTLRLKTENFLAEVGRCLVDGGLVVFNLIDSDPNTPEDLASIDASFTDSIRFPVPGTGNLVVVASPDGVLPSREEFLERAGELEADSGLPIDFTKLARGARR